MEYQALERVTPPPVLPLTLGEAKAHLRVDTTEEDDLISALIAAATDYVENWTGRALVPQIWNAYFPAFTDKVTIPKPPCISIDEIAYLNSDGTETELDVSLYAARTISQPAAIFAATNTSWPETYLAWNAVRVQFTCGYIPNDPNSPTNYAYSVPAALKAAIKLVIGDLYQNREGMALVNGAKYEANPTVINLMLPYRADMGL